MSMSPLKYIFLIILGVQHSCNALNLPKFRTILVFGDSGVDTGNNDYINTIFKANYYPYGMNYPGNTATGRYSDGKLMPDFLASSLAIKPAMPPFLQPNLSDHELLTGVVFASAGSGFDDHTTSWSNAMPLSKQPELFREYLFRLNGVVEAPEVKRIVGDALVIIHAGTVDFMYNFYILPSYRIVEYTLNAYQDFLLKNMHNFVKELYDHGCRKIVVAGLPPMGCIPLLKSAQFQPFSSSCINDVNLVAQSYNTKLEKMLQQWQSELPGSRFLYADTYSHLMDMISSPERYGFEEAARGCCGSGVFEGNQFCNLLTPLCRNPDQHIWWDSVHPTQSANKHLAQKFLPLLNGFLSHSDSQI